jgi:hypothetical protein
MSMGWMPFGAHWALRKRKEMNDVISRIEDQG